jgi:hypothetical protein
MHRFAYDPAYQRHARDSINKGNRNTNKFTNQYIFLTYPGFKSTFINKFAHHGLGNQFSMRTMNSCSMFILVRRLEKCTQASRFKKFPSQLQGRTKSLQNGCSDIMTFTSSITLILNHFVAIQTQFSKIRLVTNRRRTAFIELARLEYSSLTDSSTRQKLAHNT